MNRLHQIEFADASTITYTYDAKSRVTQIDDSLSDPITRSYDDLDRLTVETTLGSSISYTYDDGDRRTTMTVSGQPSVTYAYDDANRLTSVTQGTSTVTMTYDDADRRHTLTLPNGIVTSYDYDNADQLTALTYTLGATTLGTLTYTYDLAGRRSEGGGSWARTGLPMSVSSATYDTANRLTQWAGQSLSYDANGNLASDGLTSYTWNARKQLASMSGATSASFAYDGLGRRRAKTIGGATTNFMYDGLNVAQELSGSTPTANLLMGGIDETFMRTDAGGASTLLADALGTTLALADTSGTVQTQYTFDPFGGTTMSGAPSTNSAQFVGRESDATGLYAYRTRYYSPALLRFIAEDPAGLVGGLNLYQYVGDSPTNIVDPLGLLPQFPKSRMKERDCELDELKVCAAKCGGFSRIERCKVSQIFVLRWASAKTGPNQIWEWIDKPMNCTCKDDGSCKQDGEKAPNPSPQRVPVPGPVVLPLPLIYPTVPMPVPGILPGLVPVW
jgi:RHS repeat-associated protein